MSKRISKNATLLDNVRNTVLKYVSAPFKRLSNNQKFWVGFAFLCIVTTLLINNPFWGSTPADYEEGDIARQSIISPADITVVNKEESDRLKKEAVNTVQPIFNYEPNRAEQSVQSFRSAWEKLQRSKSAKQQDPKNGGTANSAITWSGAGGEELGRVFAARRFSTNELDFITRVLRENAGGSIYGDQDRQFLKTEVLLFDRQKNQQSLVQMPESRWISLSDARKKVREKLEGINSLSKSEVDAFEKALDPLVQPNVIYDSVATNKAKDDITKSFEPVTVSLKRGQTIVREGDTVTANIISQIDAIKTYGKSSRQLNRSIGLLLLITAMYWIAWKFIQHRGTVSRLDLSEEKTFVLFGFILIIQTALMAISFRLADFTSIQNVSAPYNDPTLWALAIPFAFSSLLMTLLADRRTALFTGVFSSLIAGLLAPTGLEFALYAFITSAVAVYGIGRYRSRQSVTIAGAMVGVSSALTAVALLAYTQQPLIP